MGRFAADVRELSDFERTFCPQDAENAWDTPVPANLEDDSGSGDGSHCVRVSGKIPAVALLHTKATRRAR